MEFERLVVLATETDWLPCKFHISHVRMALKVLRELIEQVIGELSLSKLCATVPCFEFCSKVSQSLACIVATRNWKRLTATRTLCILRIILRKCDLSPNFVRAIKLVPVNQGWNSVLGRGFGRLSPGDPTRDVLEHWIHVLRTTTNNRSDHTLRAVMTFLIGTVVPAMNIELRRDFDFAACAQVLNDDDRVAGWMGKGPNAKKKLHWLTVFANEIMRVSFSPSKHLVTKINLLSKICRTQNVDYDVHRISKEDLETLYKHSRSCVLDELMVLTLLTTGMRIGGYVGMKTKDVAHLQNGTWHVHDEGKTIEKNSKMFSFRIHPRMQLLLEDWLNNLRPFADSAFVFPGKTHGHVATHSFHQRFSRICKRAHLHGKQFHPHALRHCFAHILLEVGNPLDIVSKLMNHSSTAQTQKYYLIESAAQIASRANIPWLRKDPNAKKPESVVPDFLMSDNTKNGIEQQERSAKTILQRLEAFGQKN
jgi:integrase